ncbi:chemotaxis protein CheA [uncultured Vagococcus sp.]|uniref:chemotaxis protein CheA n=1 Tax=uncultured Vagococcus sp. TaxID=189676 RepID=UPI0028D60798|nr:chemotaxis protein CheA [uncultured Vagococcus sp.]
MDDNSKYRDLFFEETDEHLENLNASVLDLENNPSSELLDSIFRSAHTLKGMAATMGYDTMAKLTHRMENLFQLFKNGTLAINADTISLIFDCLDKLAEIVEALREDVSIDEQMIAELIQRLTAAEGGELVEVSVRSKKDFRLQFEHLSDSDREIAAEAIARGYFAYGIAVKLEAECTLKGPRVFLIMDKLEHHGEVIHTEPTAELLENGEFDQIFMMLYISQELTDKVESMILSNSEIEAVIVTSISLDEIEQLGMESRVVEVAVEETKTTEAKKVVKNDHGNQSIRVELSKLDSFMNLVSELVVYRTRLENLSAQTNGTEIKEPLEQVARITSELQDLVLKIRMQQVSVVMNRFPRVVRDLARDLNKEIDIQIEGEDTELDRTVVSELSEPLIHLIRNSADHGIETADRRRELGKPSVGMIKLTAYQQGNRVVMTVSDDGKGLNPELISESAERKGVSTAGLSEKELLNLIFHPGFSTAKEVTNVSGRGVGMDVVHSKISSLGGTIELTSEVDKGTTFTINLPLTLSIIQSLVVKVGSETFALPLGVIEKVIEIAPEEIVQVHHQEIYLYRGEATPVIRVNQALAIPSKEDNQWPHLIMVLLGKQYYALLVDELIGQQEIVIKKLGRELKEINKYLGATIQGNGDITLILDINALCQEVGGVYG